jgi:hypothetical protein
LNTSNRSLVATAHVYQTYMTLEEHYKPSNYIEKVLLDEDSKHQNNPRDIKLLCSAEEQQFDKIISCKKVLEHIDRDNKNLDSDNEQLCSFRPSDKHQVSFLQDDNNYETSTSMMIFESGIGERNYQLLELTSNDDTVKCAVYTKRNCLLDTYGWKRFKGHAKCDKKMEHFEIQAKLRSYCRKPFWKFGVFVRCTRYTDAVIDKKNYNIYWKESDALGIPYAMEYKTFFDKEKEDKAPYGFKRVCGQLVYDIKHDGH